MRYLFFCIAASYSAAIPHPLQDIVFVAFFRVNVIGPNAGDVATLRKVRSSLLNCRLYLSVNNSQDLLSLVLILQASQQPPPGGVYLVTAIRSPTLSGRLRTLLRRLYATGIVL